MKKGATELLKFQKLKRRLHLPQWGVVGVLESLWKATERNTPAGDIGRLSDEDIAAAIEWDGDPTELVNTLVETGWIDRHPEHRLVIHDWRDHVPTYMVGAFARHGKAFAGVPSTVPSTPEVEVAKDTAKDPASSPIQSIPIQTKPDQPKRGAEARPADPLFESLADACGWDWRKGLGKAARGELNTALADLRQMGATPEEVPQRAAAYRKRFGANITLTPSALAKHWPSLGSEPKPVPRPVDPELAARVAATEAAEAKRRADLSAPVSSDEKAKAQAFIDGLAAKKAMPR